MKRVEIVIPGQPAGQARPRAAVGKNGKAMLYSPKNSAEWRAYAAYAIQQSLRHNAVSPPLDDPVELVILAFFELPKSKHKKRVPVLSSTPCLKKPDFDNIAKIIGDTGNGILWRDDQQIYSCRIEKMYAPQGVPPSVILQVTWRGDDA